MATNRKTGSTKSSSSKGSGSRRSPGSGGEGDYYHVEVRPRKDFVSFRT